MKTGVKTKKQLLAELSMLRLRIAELEKAADLSDNCKNVFLSYLNMDEYPDGYASIDMKGFLTDYNSAFQKMIGYSDEELKAMTYRDLSPEKWHAMEENIIQEQILTRTHSVVYEKEYRRKDGFVFPVELRTYMLNDSNGEVTGMWAIIRDITLSKRAEEALNSSEERFYKAFQASPAPTLVSTIIEGRFLDVNNSSLSLLGYAREEMIGHTALELSLWVNPEDRQHIVAKLVKEGSIKNEAIIIRTKFGEIKETLWSCEIIKLNNEDVMLSLLYDVTERKRVENSLKESERRLMDIIDFLPDATMAIDLEGKIIAWNRAMEEMTGVMAENMMGKGNYEYAIPFYGKRRPIMLNFILKPDEKYENKYDAIIQKQKNLLIIETEVPSLRGEKAFLWGKASPLYDGKGNIVGAIESIRDITERKIHEAALQESERRLADIIDFLPDATMAIDLKGKIIAWNRAIEEMTGVKAKDMLGKENYEYAIPFYGFRRPALLNLVLKPDKEIEKNYSILKKEKDLLIVETEALSLKGKKAFLWGKASPLYDGKGNIVGAIESIRDITERKIHEAALQESERRLADIIDFLPDATMAIDLKGKIIAWNRAIEEMTGVKAKDMLGKENYEYAIPFYGFRRPALLNLVLKPDKEIEKNYSILKKEKDLLIVETEALSLKGKKAFLWGKASPLYDGKGNIVGAIESIRDITERKIHEEILRKRETDLELKTNELQDVNTALRVLLKQREGDQSRMEEKILSNVKLLIHPFIERLQNHADPKGISYVNVIKSNLQEIITPFSYNLSSKYLNLTNKEIQVANLIKEGNTTKEIAELLNSSVGVVNVHRFHIRKKLGLTKTQNLHAYLSSLTKH